MPSPRKARYLKTAPQHTMKIICSTPEIGSVTCALLLGFVCSLAPEASGQTLHTVLNVEDAGAGSLRQVLMDGTDGDTIQFDDALVGEVLVLQSGPLVIDSDLSVTGPGADQFTISGDGVFRVFEIQAGAAFELTGVTIADGYASDAGGGIWVGESAALVLSHAVVMNSEAGDNGGGIYNGSFASTSIVHSTLQGNVATGQSSPNGGGIYNASAGVVQIDSSVIANNHALRGGGVWNAGSGEMSIHATTIAGNTAGVEAGGIYNNHRLAIYNSTISGNVAEQEAGGIRNRGVDTLAITNVTISDNQAAGAGGLYNGDMGTVLIRNTTLVGNTSASAGAGFWNDDTSQVQLYSTIVASNKSDDGVASDFVSLGSIVSQGYNFIGNGDFDLRVEGSRNFPELASDRVGFRAAPLNPFLEPLDMYGGLTATHIPRAASIVIDNGDCAQTGFDVDQIGNTRLVDIPGEAYPNAGDGCDIGAVEATVSVATASEANPEETASENVLDAAFPNPFSRQSSFTIRVTKPQVVAIVLYNLLGQRVQRIYTGPLATGRTYTFDIQAANLAPGVYFYKATGTTISQSRPVVLVE